MDGHRGPVAIRKLPEQGGADRGNSPRLHALCDSSPGPWDVRAATVERTTVNSERGVRLVHRKQERSKCPAAYAHRPLSSASSLGCTGWWRYRDDPTGTF